MVSFRFASASIYIDQFFLGRWGWADCESFHEQCHPTRTQAEATLCLLTYWAHRLHPFHKCSLGPLPHKLNAGKLTGARVDQAGAVSDCLNGWDFPSDRIYPIMTDSS